MLELFTSLKTIKAITGAYRVPFCQICWHENFRPGNAFFIDFLHRGNVEKTVQTRRFDQLGYSFPRESAVLNNTYLSCVNTPFSY
jgi:hypothetical protein